MEHTCTACNHTGEDVVHYQAKVGGSDELVEQCHCTDIIACLERQCQQSGAD